MTNTVVLTPRADVNDYRPVRCFAGNALSTQTAVYRETDRQAETQTINQQYLEPKVKTSLSLFPLGRVFVKITPHDSPPVSSP